MKRVSIVLIAKIFAMSTLGVSVSLADSSGLTNESNTMEQDMSATSESTSQESNTDSSSVMSNTESANKLMDAGSDADYNIENYGLKLSNSVFERYPNLGEDTSFSGYHHLESIVEHICWEIEYNKSKADANFSLDSCNIYIDGKSYSQNSEEGRYSYS